MTKQQALKAMNEATNEMARMTEGSELYKAAKAKHVQAKAALIAIMTPESEPVELTVDAAEVELTEIVSNVEARNNELVSKAGVNTNSIIGAIASGSISTQTPEETQRIYELKQLLMSCGGYIRHAARQRNLARRAARRTERAA